MNGLVDAPEFSDRLSQPGWAIIYPKSPHNRSRLDQAEFQRASQPQEIVPILSDEICIEPNAVYSLLLILVLLVIGAAVLKTNLLGYITLAGIVFAFMAVEPECTS